MTDKTEVSDKSETSDKSKLDKLLEGENITFNCLIPGEEARDIFEVMISNANNNWVFSLEVEIRNCRLDLFQDIDSSRLVLYKVRDFMSDNDIILDLKNNKVVILNGTVLMNPQNTIYSYFPMQLQPIYAGEKGINIIIYPSRNN